MNIAFECPTSYLGIFQPLGDFDFILAHLAVKDSLYLDYYKNSNRFKIVDNSCNELRKPLDLQDVVDVAREVESRYICPPDFLGDVVSTLDAVKEAKEKCSGLVVIPIVQGKDMNDISYFADKLEEMDFSIVAIPYDILGNRDKDSLRELSLNREDVVEVFTKRGFKIHLLGVTSLWEFRAYKSKNSIVSLDTGNPITNGIAGKLYGGGFELQKTVMLDIETSILSNDQLRDCFYNIAYLRKIISKDV